MHLKYFLAGSTIIFPALVMLLLNDLSLAFGALFYLLAVRLLLPTKFWQRFVKSLVHFSNLL